MKVYKSRIRGYKYLQIQDLFSRAILMPMKDID